MDKEAILEKLKHESNVEATERICAERRQEKNIEERRKYVMSFFFELTGEPMTEEQFQQYNKKFMSETTKAGYNLMSYIKKNKIKINHDIINATFEEFCKAEGITEE